MSTPQQPSPRGGAPRARVSVRVGPRGSEDVPTAAALLLRTERNEIAWCDADSDGAPVVFDWAFDAVLPAEAPLGLLFEKASLRARARVHICARPLTRACALPRRRHVATRWTLWPPARTQPSCSWAAAAPASRTRCSATAASRSRADCFTARQSVCWRRRAGAP
jgi:hypothetical protein